LVPTTDVHLLSASCLTVLASYYEYFVAELHTHQRRKPQGSS
jgi:hypothetical protein